MTRTGYPIQTRAERIADGSLHAVGVILAVTGAVLLIVLASGKTGPGTIAAISIYSGALIATFVASAFYHMTPWEDWRPTFRRIDHAAIYLKIAGTYTPLVAFLGSAFAWTMLGVIWALAAIGAVAKLFYWTAPGGFATILYLALGWLSVLLVWPLAQALPVGGLALILIGGILYTIGAILFQIDGLKFQNAIWHGFVLAASGCFFAVITWGAFSVGTT